MDIEQLLTWYVQEQRAKGLRPNTVRVQQYWLRRWLAHSAGALTVQAARAWIASLQAEGLAQHSISGAARVLKAFGHWLEVEEYCATHPFQRLALPRVDDAPREYFTPHEMQRLLNTCQRTTLLGSRDYALLLLLFSTGLRATECVSLRLDDLNGAQSQILVRRGKGGKFRVVPYTRQVQRAVQRYLAHPTRQRQDDAGHVFLSRDGTALRRVGLQELVLRRGARVGLHAYPHKFRHTCAITYLRNGGRLEVLQKLLGHTRLDMTLHYARLAGVDVQQGHDTADPLLALRRN